MCAFVDSRPIYISLSRIMGSSINDVMLFWGIFYPPPPSCFFMHPSTLLVMRTQTPPPPLRHDVIYGQPPWSVHQTHATLLLHMTHEILVNHRIP